MTLQYKTHLGKFTLYISDSSLGLYGRIIILNVSDVYHFIVRFNAVERAQNKLAPVKIFTPLSSVLKCRKT